MNKKILAITMSIVLTAALISATNANALISSENKAFNVILKLTQQAKDKLANNVQPTLTTIKQDLQFKKKFYQFEPFPVQGANAVQIRLDRCNFNDPSACAFNVESIQLNGHGIATDIVVDGAKTSISPVHGPTNFLVDSGHGQIWASKSVELQFDTPFTGDVEFNGEKPQGANLCKLDGTGNWAFGSDSWSTKAPIPIAREGYGAARDGSSIFYIAGFDGGDSNINERYNILSDTWDTKAPMPGAAGKRSETAAVKAAGAIYVIGGRSGVALQDTWRYDPSSDSWTQVANMIFPTRTEHMVVTDGSSKIFVAGGGTSTVPGSGARDDLQIYDIPSDTWSTGASLPFAVSDALAVLHDGKIYVVAGRDNSGTVLDTLLIYDIKSNTWSSGASMPAARGNPVGGVVCNQIVAIGGETGAPPSTPLTGNTFIYDIPSDSWSSSVSMPFGAITAEIQAVVDGNRIHVVGGGIFGSGASNNAHFVFTKG